MSSLPREARDGLMRAWLELLRERHPGVTWIVAEESKTASRVGSEAAREG